jgi:type IV secretion system protein VirB3
LESLDRDRLFVALTRPQMFAGVTYSLFVINFVVAAEFFLLFRSLSALVPALLLHLLGVLLCLRDPRAIDLWLIWARTCGRTRNHGLWRCNSYRP